VLAGRAGATVVCADVDEPAARTTADLVAAEGATAHVLTADVSDADACGELVARAEERMGGLDGLVCNIGIGAGMGLPGATAAQWDAVFAVNARAHFLLAAAASCWRWTAGSPAAGAESARGAQRPEAEKCW
jgi:NAD(P)-dependent dehydrogenase (short-subunit alcohol dehydrogenase family)